MIEELQSENQWKEAFPVLSAFRPTLRLDEFLNSREHLLASGYRLYGFREDKLIVCVAGVSVVPHILRQSELRVNDLATLESHRSKGCGLAIMKHIERVALKLNCSRVILYSQIANERAHAFYEQKACYTRYGIEFTKEIDLECDGEI